MSKLPIGNIQSPLDETYHNITCTSTEGLFTTSLNTFTDYIRHTYQPVAVTFTIETECTQCPSPVSSEVVLVQLINELQ